MADVNVGGLIALMVFNLLALPLLALAFGRFGTKQNKAAKASNHSARQSLERSGCSGSLACSWTCRPRSSMHSRFCLS